MKLFQLNLISFLGLALAVILFLVIPSLVIKLIWNGVYGGFLERDLSIDIWQASLLWGAAITLIYMSGIVRIDFQTIDSIDLDSIDNSDLREKIRKLKEERDQEKSHNKSSKFELDPQKKEQIIEHLKRSFAMSPDDVQELRTKMMDKLKEEEQAQSDELNQQKSDEEDKS